MRLGETIRAAREALGLSLRDVRIMTGVVESELRAIEDGMVTPDPAEIMTLSDVLDLDIGRKGEAEER